MRRTLVLFLPLVLLWTLLSQLNHSLTGFPFRAYLFAGGLFVTYAALTQPLRSGLAATILGGLLCDAAAPANIFGLQMLLFVAGHLVIYNLRDRVPRDDTTSRIVVTLLANLALFLAFSFLQIVRSSLPAAVWPRLLVDLVCSQIFLALIARWFFAFQTRALVLTQVERETFA